MAVRLPDVYLEQARHPAAVEEVLIDHQDRRGDYSYEDDQIHPLDVTIDGGIEKPLPDSFYQDWEEEHSKTYADVFIDDTTMASLLEILYGSGGYFMLRGAVTAHSNGHPSIDSRLAGKSKGKSRRQSEEIDVVLEPTLDAAGVSLVERRQKTNEVIEAIRAAFSGQENRLKLKKEKQRLNLGKTAIKRAS